jgi:hypothetical protein
MKENEAFPQKIVETNQTMVSTAKKMNVEHNHVWIYYKKFGKRQENYNCWYFNLLTESQWCLVNLIFFDSCVCVCICSCYSIMIIFRKERNGEKVKKKIDCYWSIYVIWCFFLDSIFLLLLYWVITFIDTIIWIL